jgi:hypothetical protein
MLWLTSNWFSIVETISLVATLTVAICALRPSTKAVKSSVLLNLVNSNREIWGKLVTNPKLQSAVRSTIPAGKSITSEEKQFVKEVILHSLVSFEIAKMGGLTPTQGVRIDIHDTMSLPVFNTVWNELKVYQPKDFVEFIDNCIAGIDLDKPFGQESLAKRIAYRAIKGRWSDSGHGSATLPDDPHG